MSWTSEHRTILTSTIAVLRREARAHPSASGQGGGGVGGVNLRKLPALSLDRGALWLTVARKSRKRTESSEEVPLLMRRVTGKECRPCLEAGVRSWCRDAGHRGTEAPTDEQGRGAPAVLAVVTPWPKLPLEGTEGRGTPEGAKWGLERGVWEVPSKRWSPASGL